MPKRIQRTQLWHRVPSHAWMPLTVSAVCMMQCILCTSVPGLDTLDGIGSVHDAVHPLHKRLPW